MKRPGYLGNAEPMKAKAARAEEVQTAIQTSTGPGASEVARQTRQENLPETKLKEEKIKKEVAAKAEFPPGLIVSEQARLKMEQHKAHVAEVSAKKEQTRLGQQQRWQARHDVAEKWRKLEEKHQAKRQELLAKWDAQDQRKAAHRQAVIAKLTAGNASPAAVEAQKQKFAQEDTIDALTRTEEIAHHAQRELQDIDRQEKAQIQRDKTYNFFAGMMGWQKRVIPQ